MFEFFYNKNARIQKKIDRYIDLEKSHQSVLQEIEDMSDEFIYRKNGRDALLKSNADDAIKNKVQEKYDLFTDNHIRHIGDVKKRKDKIEKSMSELMKGDDEFRQLVENTKKNRRFSLILEKYRKDDIQLAMCDTLLKAVTKEKVRYADNIVFNEKGQLLLLKRSELDDSKPGYYTIPGGHVDPGEDYETAAKREMEEEAGIKVDEVTKVGEFENDDVKIEYFQSFVENVEPVLQEEEIWSYEWIDPKKLDDYKLPFNMSENLTKILFPYKYKVVKIKKSFENGLIDEKQRDILLKSIVKKANEDLIKSGKYTEKLERLEARRTDRQYSKKEADYMPYWSDENTQCHMCEYYRNGSCLRVEGEIESDAHCKFFEIGDFERSGDDDLEKAWNAAQIGEIRTRKDGKKYRKVANTGNTKNDWRLVTPSKTEKQDENSADKTKTAEEGKNTKVSEKELKKYAQKSSETALQNTIKQSDNPDERKVAHEELDRRQKEEKPQEKEVKSGEKEKKEDKKTENEFKPDVDLNNKFISDMYFERYDKKLDTKQIEAIHDYQENGETINTDLRKGNETGKDISEIDKLFNDFKLDHNIEVKRLIVTSNSKIQEQLNNLKVGDSLNDKGYLSTTTTDDTLDKFRHPKEGNNFTLTIRVKKGQKFIPAKNYSKIDYRDENEMLFPRDSHIKIISKEGNNIIGELTYGKR